MDGYIAKIFKENFQINEKKILDLINVDLNRFDINNTAPNLEIWVDETKLIIALRNLIDNALKYGDPEQLVEIEVLKKQQVVMFKITNYGNKIQSSDLNSIFKPFFRSQNNKNTIICCKDNFLTIFNECSTYNWIMNII